MSEFSEKNHSNTDKMINHQQTANPPASSPTKRNLIGTTLREIRRTDLNQETLTEGGRLKK